MSKLVISMPDPAIKRVSLIFRYRFLYLDGVKTIVRIDLNR